MEMDQVSYFWNHHKLLKPKCKILKTIALKFEFHSFIFCLLNKNCDMNGIIKIWPDYKSVQRNAFSRSCKMMIIHEVGLIAIVFK